MHQERSRGRNTARVGAVTSLMIIAACTLPVSGQNQQSGPESAILPPASTAEFPDKLPASVQAITSSVVELAAIRGSEASVASAVKVTDNEFLTAGHVIDTSTHQLRPLAESCSAFVLESKSMTPKIVVPVSLVSSYDKRSVSLSDMPPSYYDAGLVRTSLSTAGIHPVPGVQPAKPGEYVYFVNYQEFASRSNGSTKRVRNALSNDELLSAPAEFGGVVLASKYEATSDEIQLVLTGVKSYGKNEEPRLTNGGSGGGVFVDRNGQAGLVGVSVAAQTDRISAGEAARMYGVSLPRNINPYTTAQISIIVPVNYSPVFPELQTAIDAAPLCLRTKPDGPTN